MVALGGKRLDILNLYAADVAGAFTHRFAHPHERVACVPLHVASTCYL